MSILELSEDDVILFDLITFSYRNIMLIYDLTTDLENEVDKNQKGNASKFYSKWCHKRLKGKEPAPYNPGTVWMITSIIMVTSNERWFDLLPDTLIQDSSEWGLNQVQMIYPSCTNPTIRDVIYQIRNSISHSDFSVHIGDVNLPWIKLLKESYFIFRDTRTRKKFELKISMFELWNLNVQIYSTIQQAIESYVRVRTHFESTQNLNNNN